MLTKEQVQTSMEARWHKHKLCICKLALGICAALCVAALILCFLLSRFDVMPQDTAQSVSVGMSVLLLLFSLPFLAVFLSHQYRYRKLFEMLETYRIYDAMLKDPVDVGIDHMTAYRFQLYFETETHEHITLKTPALWSDSRLEPFHTKNYHDRTIRIAYSQALRRCIILGE